MAVPDRVPRPTVRGWGFLIAGVSLLIAMEMLQRREFAFVALFVLFLPLFAAVVVSLRRLPLTVERVFSPEVAAAGGSVDVRLLLRNWSSLRVPESAWFDDASDPIGPGEPRALAPLAGFDSLASDTPSPVSLKYRLLARHRGRHDIGPLTVLLSDPFGMMVREVRIGGSDVLTVTPSTVALPRGAVRLGTGSGLAQQSRQLGGAGEQDVISRKYQTGDSMRRVNWSATARFGELMVRQDDQQSDQHAVVLLDTSTDGFVAAELQDHPFDPTNERDGGTAARHHATDPSSFSPEFEWAVSMSASIGLHLLAEGYHVRLLTSADARAAGSRDALAADTVFEPSGEEGLLLHAADFRLASVRDVDFRAAVTRSEATVGELPPVFAVVGRLDEASARSLASASRLSSGAVAIIVVPGGSVGRGGAYPRWATDLRDQLESAGWVAQCVGSDEAPSSVWGTVDGERLVL